jgi:hypothetical protein
VVPYILALAVKQISLFYPIHSILRKQKNIMKKFFTLVLITITTMAYSQSTVNFEKKETKIKVSTNDSSAVKILRSTYKCSNECINSQGNYEFTFPLGVEARLITNLYGGGVRIIQKNSSF